MKNKFLALAAFGAATLGGAILSSPANAQIPNGSGPVSTFNVNVTVPEVLYLRTVDTATVAVTPGQLVGAAGAAALTQVSPNGYINGSPDQAVTSPGVLDTTSPFAVNSPATLSIPNAYIVWSNSPTGTYSVDIVPSQFNNSSPAGGNFTPTITSTTTGLTALGLTHSTANNIDFTVPLSATTVAGTYGGTITIDAYTP